MPGSLHLYIGQEAVAVGVCALLDDRDYVTSTHRGHGHYLAKGGDVAAMFAEIWGKRRASERGGSMHVADLSGDARRHGGVGAGLAIATGAALGAQLDGDGKVAVCFFGDGAANQGVLMETLNVAAIWAAYLRVREQHVLRVHPVARDHGWADRRPHRAFDVPTHEVDGNDGRRLAVGAGADRHACAGGGPSFPMADTYRIHGHMERELFILGEGRYRDDDEIAEWRAKDPLDRLARLLAQGIADQAALEERHPAARWSTPPRRGRRR